MCWRPLVVCFCLLCMLVGCATKKTIVTSEGTTTVETNRLHNTIKLSSERGTAIIGRGAVDPKTLGLPLYPGAIAAQTGAMVTHTNVGSSSVVSLTTKDSFDSVYQWYRKQMPPGSEQTHMQLADGSVASFLSGKLGDPDQKSVVITQNKGTTTIMLTHTSKKS
jgi:hypothetical protein